nr:peroxidase 64-like [Ipomoea trifida]
MASIVALLSSLLVFSIISLGNALSSNYYEKTCPQAENAVTQVVKKASMADKTVPAALLRMHFHDLLLNSKKSAAEKNGPPNLSLHAFYVIDDAKKAVEAICPGVVSCADILAFAARDAVVIAGGPYWDVPKGRKDGRVSKASETIKLPGPGFNLSQLQKSFSQRGLSMADLVALSGGHTIGFSHCSSFNNRLHNFNATHDVDPTLHPTIAANLKAICPLNSKSKNAGTSMDPSSNTFDNNYYKLIAQGKSLFSSDQALFTNPNTKSLVLQYANSKEAFFKAFANSMIKMSSITGGQEVRRDCRIAN